MIKVKKEILIAVKETKTSSDSITKIAKKYKIDRHTLSKYTNIDLNNIIYSQYHNCYIIFNEKEKNAIYDYIENNRSFEYIHKMYNYKSSLFKDKLKAIGYDSNRRYKKQFNRNSFNLIKSEEDAYFLGFILADGYVNEKRGSLVIKLNAKDEDILIKFLNYMNADFNIKYCNHGRTGNLLAFVEIDSREIINNLIKYNVRQGKSGKEKPYLQLDEELKKHYIRGLIDGDGFITKKRVSIGCCGSKEILTYIIEELSNKLDLKFKNKFEPYWDKNSNIYRMQLTGENARKTIEYLYKNSNIYLNRKYELAKRYFEEPCIN